MGHCPRTVSLDFIMPFTQTLIEQSANYSVSSDGKITRTYNEKYRCRNDTLLTLDQVQAASGFVALQVYSGNSLAFCRAVRPNRLFMGPSKFVWELDVEWSSECPQAAENPVNRPVLRRVYSNETQRQIFRNASGQIVLNSAGDPPDGGISVNHHMPAINWKRNEAHAGFSIGTFNQLSGKLNSTSFAGCDPGTLLLIATADEAFESTYHYWSADYTMVYNDQGWQPQFLNAGLQELKTVGGVVVKVPIFDGSSQPVQTPEPLTTGGVKVPYSSRPSGCNFITVTYSGTFDFSTLGLSLT